MTGGFPLCDGATAPLSSAQIRRRQNHLIFSVKFKQNLHILDNFAAMLWPELKGPLPLSLTTHSSSPPTTAFFFPNMDLYRPLTERRPSSGRRGAKAIFTGLFLLACACGAALWSSGAAAVPGGLQAAVVRAPGATTGVRG